tara:strand:+ start:320 stop:487 length:168 start_codon:yes stop_codon:yes gene_type:complete
MISPSAGSLSEEQFLAEYLERLKDGRVAEPGEKAMRGKEGQTLMDKAMPGGSLKV